MVGITAELPGINEKNVAQMECTRRVRVKPDFSLPGVIQQGPAFPPLWRPRARLAPAAAGAASAPSPKDRRIHSFGA